MSLFLLSDCGSKKLLQEISRVVTHDMMISLLKTLQSKATASFFISSFSCKWLCWGDCGRLLIFHVHYLRKSSSYTRKLSFSDIVISSQTHLRLQCLLFRCKKISSFVSCWSSLFPKLTYILMYLKNSSNRNCKCMMLFHFPRGFKLNEDDDETEQNFRLYWEYSSVLQERDVFCRVLLNFVSATLFSDHVER